MPRFGRQGPAVPGMIGTTVEVCHDRFLSRYRMRNNHRTGAPANGAPCPFEGEMMDTIMIVALAPFYAAAVACTYWGIAYGWHMLRRIDQSAVETQVTETTTPPTAGKV